MPHRSLFRLSAGEVEEKISEFWNRIHAVSRHLESVTVTVQPGCTRVLLQLPGIASMYFVDVENHMLYARSLFQEPECIVLAHADCLMGLAANPMLARALDRLQQKP